MDELVDIHRIPPQQPLFSRNKLIIGINYSRKRHRYRNPNTDNSWNQCEDVKTISFGFNLEGNMFNCCNMTYDNQRFVSVTFLWFAVSWAYWFDWMDENLDYDI